MSIIFSKIKRGPRAAGAGFTLIEMMVYIGLLGLLLVAVLNVVGLVFGTYGSVENQNKLLTSGETAMERMSRAIRSASSINGAGSLLGASPGDLKLNTTDPSGNPATVEFSVQGGALDVAENGGTPSPLTDSAVSVQSLVFTSIQTANSQAVRISLALQTGASPSVASTTFYDTIVLRGSY